MLEPRVAIVTGSTRGIGLRIALAMREAGASVMCNARTVSTPELDDAMARTHGMRFRAADVSTHDGAEELVAATLGAFGRLDILVNNAGSQPSGAWSDADRDGFDAVMKANAAAVECATRAALPLLRRAADGAAIVNVASVRAERPGQRMAHYAASKAAIVALTRALAIELGPQRIRVNAVSPGLIDRPGLAESWPDGVARYASEAPLQRIGRAEDVAAACVFLASPAAAWITGVNLVVDGGISLVR
jgi:NAD(P)-dependent dehydrogenase (short-subunit alcohol dehydrogenase family)